ncbi:hypothetical protein [Clostridium sp.]|uniref:hypothetical protein n=1 Tax=Clostridium sp. TaxID=1506 RepID=UPI0032178A47
MLKDKLRKIIDDGNARISELQKKIVKIKESPMYSYDYKLQVNADYRQECIKIRNEVHDKVIKLFDEEIERVNSENYYKNIDSLETSNILKMIELLKDTMGKEEVNYLLRIYDNNNMVKRVLASIAESKDVKISGIKYLPNSVELENMKQKFSGTILQSTDEGIESLKIELLLRSIS